MDASRRAVLAGLGNSVLAFGLSVDASKTARAAEFYQCKLLTLIVGFAPGGGVDTTARVVARHMVRFIPGQPGVLVQNMEAAAGLVAATHLSRRGAAHG